MATKDKLCKANVGSRTEPRQCGQPIAAGMLGRLRGAPDDDDRDRHPRDLLPRWPVRRRHPTPRAAGQEVSREVERRSRGQGETGPAARGRHLRRRRRSTTTPWSGSTTARDARREASMRTPASPTGALSSCTRSRTWSHSAPRRRAPRRREAALEDAAQGTVGRDHRQVHRPVAGDVLRRRRARRRVGQPGLRLRINAKAKARGRSWRSLRARRRSHSSSSTRSSTRSPKHRRCCSSCSPVPAAGSRRRSDSTGPTSRPTGTTPR